MARRTRLWTFCSNPAQVDAPEGLSSGWTTAQGRRVPGGITSALPLSTGFISFFRLNCFWPPLAQELCHSRCQCFSRLPGSSPCKVLRGGKLGAVTTVEVSALGPNTPRWGHTHTRVPDPSHPRATAEDEVPPGLAFPGVLVIAAPAVCGGQANTPWQNPDRLTVSSLDSLSYCCPFRRFRGSSGPRRVEAQIPQPWAGHAPPQETSSMRPAGNNPCYPTGETTLVFHACICTHTISG